MPLLPCVQDFYGRLSECAAIATAFGSSDYLWRLASSSVHTAISLGVPLVLPEAALEPYGGLDPEACWVQRQPACSTGPLAADAGGGPDSCSREDAASLGDVLRTLLAAPPAQHAAKFEEMAALRGRKLRWNVELFGRLACRKGACSPSLVLAGAADSCSPTGVA